VASEIGSYKPGVAHWETFFRRTGAERSRHVHVAASLFHDIAPAAALGLPCVWINRLGETSEIPRADELPDLSALPETLEGLVPTG
jgi:2-haloacid dehalogenase